MRRRLLTRVTVSITVLAAAAGVLVAPGPAGAGTGTGTGTDAFYRYTGSTPLSSIAPGTVLKTRTISYHLAGIPVPLSVVQLQYRSTLQTGGAGTNITSVIEPPMRLGPATKVAAYQSFYDSLNPADSPSRAIAGGLSLGTLIPDVETGLLVPELLQGIPVVVADTEGQAADFAAGPEYGMNTLDSLRAAFNSPATGIAAGAKVAMFGYSGGAIATEWAAELAPTYAPDVNEHLVGAAMGGTLVDPAHNLHYVDGTPLWSAVLPMAIIGISRAFRIDLTPYLNAHGRSVYTAMHKVSIAQAFAQYAGQSWAKLAKPQYPTPESVPLYVRTVNKLIMGTGGTPTVPLFFGQGANGILEGTPASPTYGPGDGVMIAGDVRSLARQYCGAGVTVQYQQYDLTSHVTSAPQWIAGTLAWLSGRFAGQQAPSSCGRIAAGNSLAPIGG